MFSWLFQHNRQQQLRLFSVPAPNKQHSRHPPPRSSSTSPPPHRRGDMLGDTGAAAALQTLRDAANNAVQTAFAEGNSKRKRAAKDTAVEGVRLRLAELFDVAETVRAGAEGAAARVKEDAETEAAEIRRAARVEREVLDAEKAAMEKTYEFQMGKIKLDVGGHTFPTSRITLASVPDTYLDSLVSGRYLLSADPTDGTYFIDRSGAHFEHILNYLRDPGRDESTQY